MTENDRAALAVLKAVSRSRVLLDDYVLKGGYTLFHVFGSPRRSYDLDFNAAKPFSREITAEKNELLNAFCLILESEMANTGADFGFRAMEVHWRKFSEELPTLLARVGYAEEAPDEGGFEHFVEMQVTLSEIICEATRAEVDGIPVHIPTLEDILADKLKALLQQAARDVSRPNDVYDLWYFTTQSGHALDLEKLARFLQVKSAGTPDLQPLTTERFHDPAVRRHALRGYDAVRPNLADASYFPSGGAAFDAVLAFVDRLELPGVQEVF